MTSFLSGTLKRLKIVSVVGARPQFIKSGILSRTLRKIPEITEIVIHTGQHYDTNMSQVFFQQLGMPEPDHHLGIGSVQHGAQTGRMLEKIEEVLVRETPNWVLVYGDTNSTLAGALAATKLHIRLAHVEAGLRSFNRQMPEEINRVVADHLSDLLFSPTNVAVENLRKEGIDTARIRLVGDIMYEAALLYGNKAEADSGILEQVGLSHAGYILATIHRAQNTDDPDRLNNICSALCRLATDCPVVFPLHPRTRKMMLQSGLLGANSQPIRFLHPVGYLDMVMLEKHARLIITDSGGVQKEAYFYRVPCVTLRDETEWRELVEVGWNRLVPPNNPDVILREIRQSLLKKPDQHSALYGDGQTAEKICEVLVESSR